MSYARFSNADVYVFLSCEGWLECCGCWLGKSWSFFTTEDMLQHLMRHLEAGHDVPDFCVQGLVEDEADNDAWIARVSAGACSDCDGSGKCRVCHGSGIWKKPGGDEPCYLCVEVYRTNDGSCGHCKGRGGSPAWLESQRVRQ